MDISEYDRKQINEFWTAIQPRLPGYGQSSLSYIAVKRGSELALAYARLHLVGLPHSARFGKFQSRSIVAGRCSLTDLKQSPAELVAGSLTGKLETPSGDLLFLPPPQQSYSVFFSRFYGSDQSFRQMQLFFRGDHTPLSHPADYDWELKSLSQPYRTLRELCLEYDIGSFNEQQSCLEVVAESIVRIHPESTITNKRATLRVALAFGLDPAKARIGYCVRDKDKTLLRNNILGTAIEWSQLNGMQIGDAEFEVPAGAVLDCVANYDDEAHHSATIKDPATTDNVLRLLQLTFDENLEQLQKLLKIQPKKGVEARDLEVAIHWLFWMLGFSTTHLGPLQLQDGAPDLIAVSPQGDILVIECTTSILKAENKLANLVARSEKVKQKLAASGHPCEAVLPVMITNLTRQAVNADAENAEKSGILVITCDDFPAMLDLSHSHNAANQYCEKARKKLRVASTPNPFAGWLPS